MRYWIFQSNPADYDLASDLETMDIGDRSEWNVAKYRDEMTAGDNVAFWVAGKDGGLFALGELVSEVYQGKAFQDPEEIGDWVDWKLDRKIIPPITRARMKLNPILNKMRPIAPVYQGTNFPVTPEQWNEMMRLIERSDSGEAPMGRRSNASDTRTSSARLEDLANLTYMDVRDWLDLETLIRDKKQIIFEGPPGAGKTYIARLFARYLAGLSLEGELDDHVEIVQFHQSYGYEDFVAGIRPVTNPDSGTLTYETRPGIFLEMCQRAAAHPDDTFVLIIDEINRGNLSRIFGELLYGLEYRDQPVRMQYPVQWGDEIVQHLTIPDNLLLIGTMNSTDRSLAMVDYALRRRFYFWRLLPVEDDRAPVLERWLAAQDNLDPADRAWVLKAFVELNKEIRRQLGADYQIGHSYFMLNDGLLKDPDARARVWRHAIEPLLREYFHTRHDADMQIDALRSHMLTIHDDMPAEDEQDDSIS